MFDAQLPPVADLGEADDAAVVTAISGWARIEAQAAARRLHAIGELVYRRCGDGERAHWACDDWDAAAAEVSAALGISRRRASGQMYQARSLRERLPKVAARFAAGDISARVVGAITWGTDLVFDPQAVDLIDAAIAGRATRWEALSQDKLEKVVDAIVDTHDPGAVRRTRATVRSREVSFGGMNSRSGTTSMWGRLLGADAAVLDRRLAEMAHGVCDDDPRTLAQRRADALGALGAGSTHLACQCGDPDCPAAGADGRAAAVVIHVLADADALQAATDPAMCGEGRQPESSARPPGTAVIAGGPPIPTPLLAQLVADGAAVRPVLRPPVRPEQGYRPSTALQDFVRARDLTCRFPNCDVPADRCDVDHAMPWPFGPTHPSNLRCLCRKDHLLKTFWTGSGGWSDQQDPDGTITWTSPAGQTYVTHPGSGPLFPDWDTDTGPLPDRPPPPPGAAQRGVMMPTRRRTRATERLRRITSERSYNDAHVAERNMPPPF